MTQPQQLVAGWLLVERGKSRSKSYSVHMCDNQIANHHHSYYDTQPLIQLRRVRPTVLSDDAVIKRAKAASNFSHVTEHCNIA
jgi:hypothetical protein